jgi:SAM-dependent methyltransferase
VSGSGNRWDDRYAGESYLFGEAPNVFLASQRDRLKPGWRALAVADGEGRNGVWLAEQGLVVESVDGSVVAQSKAKKLAAARGVSITCTLADLSQWSWPQGTFDLVVGIFVQFASPALRGELFQGMKRALKPGGLLMLEGYRPEQLRYGTGGPSTVENLYTETMLREAFSDIEILELNSHDSMVNEGTGHNGMSALIDLVAQRHPQRPPSGSA